MDEASSQLTTANAREILAAFKMDRLGPLQRAAAWLVRGSARRLSRQMLHVDDLVGRCGLAAAGRYLLDEFAGSVDVSGQEHVPRAGPVLALANHPGVVDVAAIWLALERRSDLKVIAADRDILRLMPNTRQRLLLVAPQAGGRTGLLRAAADHLRRGGALLNFPAGAIEPDPQLRLAPPAAGWVQSSELLLRLAPQTVVLPVAVAGVIARSAHEHWIAKRFADPKEREWAAATLQVLFRRLRDAHTRVLIGEPIASTQPGRHAATQAAMASLLARVARRRDVTLPTRVTSDRPAHEHG